MIGSENWEISTRSIVIGGNSRGISDWWIFRVTLKNSCGMRGGFEGEMKRFEKFWKAS